MIVAEGVCQVMENGVILCTMSMASVSAVIFLAAIGVAIQVYRVAETFKKE